jgi:LPXTG-motif cell wall-anchored protein
MVEGEIVTLEYIAHASADLQPGVYEDIAYVKGVSIVGNEVLGNVSTGSTSEFVGTEVKILGATVSSDSNISESTVSLPKTGANSYLTLLGLLSFIFGLGVLIKDRKLCFN